MIAATVEAAKGKKGAAAPPQLVFAWRCQEYHALPRSGSLGDQDYREMYLIDTLPRIYEAVYHWRTQGGFNLSAGDKSIIAWLVKSRMM